MHLDEPLPVRYLYWIKGVLHGDLGESLRMQKPVLELILEKLPVTLELAAFAIVIALVDRRSRRHPLGRQAQHRVGLRARTPSRCGACPRRISGSAS